MDKINAQQFIESALDKAWNNLFSLYGSRIGKKPSIELNTRLRTTAGRAWLLHNKIDISYKLLIEFPDHFAADTIPHECVHFVAYRVFGEQNHGKPWKYIMAQLGLPTTPYHTLCEKLAVIKAARLHGLNLPKQITLTNGHKVDTIDTILRIVNK